MCRRRWSLGQPRPGWESLSDLRVHGRLFLPGGWTGASAHAEEVAGGRLGRNTIEKARDLELELAVSCCAQAELRWGCLRSRRGWLVPAATTSGAKEGPDVLGHRPAGSWERSRLEAAGPGLSGFQQWLSRRPSGYALGQGHGASPGVSADPA